MKRKNTIEENIGKYGFLIKSGSIIDKIEEEWFLYSFKSNDITIVFISLHKLIANLQFNSKSESLF